MVHPSLSAVSNGRHSSHSTVSMDEDEAQAGCFCLLFHSKTLFMGQPVNLGEGEWRGKNGVIQQYKFNKPVCLYDTLHHRRQHNNQPWSHLHQFIKSIVSPPSFSWISSAVSDPDPIYSSLIPLLHPATVTHDNTFFSLLLCNNHTHMPSSPERLPPSTVYLPFPASLSAEHTVQYV